MSTRCGAGTRNCRWGDLASDHDADGADGLRPRPRAEDAPRPTTRRRPRRPSLSPSRAADFKTCPLLYRFRTIDRLPERKSLAAVRGTLVHSVLERLYDLPAAAAHGRGRPGAARAGLGRAARGAGRRRAVRRRAGRRRGDRPHRRPSRSRRGCSRPASWSRSTSRSRTRPASSRTAARNWSRSPCPTGCCCAASSTGWTSPRTAPCGSSTTRPARCRARRSRARRCSR